MTATAEQKQVTIVVADDDFDVLRMVTQHLSRRYTKVLDASDGEEAIRLARDTKPDLVILDVMMPGMSGWEVCRAIREDPELSATKVLVCTGVGERLNELTSPLYGADASIDKPFELVDLQKQVDALLS